MIKLQAIFTEVEVKLGKDATRQFQSKLEDVLDNWLMESDEESAKWLYKNFSTFKKLKTKYPKIFAPKLPNGTKLYRGLSKPSQELIDQVVKDKSNKDELIKHVRNVPGAKKDIEALNDIFGRSRDINIEEFDILIE